MNFTVKKFGELSTNELFRIYRLRARVFVVEQNCAYQDVDEKDLKALHLMMHHQDDLIGYSRLLPPGVSYPEPSIGRVVVDKDHRKKGAGRQLMEKSIRESITHFNCAEIVISAQTYLRRFYESLGFMAEGNEYPEDDIPHICMRWKKEDR
jgi:ElaA protein